MNGRWLHRAQGALAQADWWLDGPLLKPIRKIAEALVVAAGPWVLAVVTLALLGRTAEHWLGAEALENVRLAVVYAFMLAPMVAAPLGIVAARAMTTSSTLGQDNSALAALILVTCGAAGVAAQALSASVVFALGLTDPELALAFVVLTSASAMMWTAFIIINVYRLRSHLLLSFAAGMGITLILCQFSIQTSASGPLLVWCFAAGMALSFGLCLAPFPITDVSAASVRQTTARLRATLSDVWPLALGALLAILGVWADKWVAWVGPQGMVSAAGFVHSPTYDSPMFLAHLAAIPGLAALTLHIEGEARRAMERFQNALAYGASLFAAEQAASQLSVKLWRVVCRVVLTQLAFCGLLFLLAPTVASFLGLRLDQFLILRTALVGSFLHVLFLATSAILIMCNRKMAFLFLQFLFLSANVAGTVMLTAIYGATALGFAVACGIGGAAATFYAMDTLRRLLQFCFVLGNDALFRQRDINDG